MKLSIVIKALIMSYFFSQPAIGDSLSESHQEEMKLKMQDMDKVISGVNQSSDGWKVREGMKEHAVLMNDTVRIFQTLSEARRKKIKECMVKDSNEESSNCREIDSHIFLQDKIIVDLLAHVIHRQNVILDKIGILTNAGK